MPMSKVAPVWKNRSTEKLAIGYGGNDLFQDRRTERIFSRESLREGIPAIHFKAESPTIFSKLRIFCCTVPGGQDRLSFLYKFISSHNILRYTSEFFLLKDTLIHPVRFSTLCFEILSYRSLVERYSGNLDCLFRNCRIWDNIVQLQLRIIYIMLNWPKMVFRGGEWREKTGRDFQRKTILPGKGQRR